MSDEGQPPEDPPRPPHVPERFERTPGRRIGDQRVKIVRRRGFRRGRGVIVATEESLESAGLGGRAISVVREILFGKRIPTERESEERLTKVTGLAIFASDNISSSAYATEETMRALALAGAAGLAFTMPLTIAIIAILAIVVTSYLQVIKAYPNGGGSYVVASRNLGVVPGLLAAAALLVDYVLTVSVSVAGGVLAITTAFPGVDPLRVWVGVAFIVLLTIGNLRGIREAGGVIGLLTASIVGQGVLFYIVQAATAIILVLAANTSFSGFPRLASILATDRFMPRQFAQRGDRLAYSFGILVLAMVSALLLIA